MQKDSSDTRLDNDQFEPIKQAIARYYKTQHASIKRILDGTPFPIADCFINVALLTKEQQDRNEVNAKRSSASSNLEKPLRERLNQTWETVYAAKQPLALKKLFTWQKDEPRPVAKPTRLSLIGRAGIGKTTLCQYLAYR